jgi:hypothetical protein
MSDEEFERVMAALNNLKPHVKPEALAAQIDTDARIVEIVKMVAGLSIARANADAPPDEFASGIAKSITARKDKSLDRALIEARLKSLLSIEPVMLSARAFNVQHEYEHVFRTARIVTDIRPVFDHAGATVTAALIVHSLKISFVHNSEVQDVVFAMDDEDLAELKKVLERAETKSLTLEKLVNSIGVPYFESKPRKET